MNQTLLIPEEDYKDLGRAVMMIINQDGSMELDMDPFHGYPMRVWGISEDLAIIVKIYPEGPEFIDALRISNNGSLDAKTREAIRDFRTSENRLITVLEGLPGRDQLKVENGCHKIFWTFISGNDERELSRRILKSV